MFAGWQGELACHPDSEVHVSSNKLNYRIWFIVEGGHSNEFK